MKKTGEFRYSLAIGTVPVEIIDRVKGKKYRHTWIKPSACYSPKEMALPRDKGNRDAPRGRNNRSIYKRAPEQTLCWSDRVFFDC